MNDCPPHVSAKRQVRDDFARDGVIIEHPPVAEPFRGDEAAVGEPADDLPRHGERGDAIARVVDH